MYEVQLVNARALVNESHLLISIFHSVSYKKIERKKNVLRYYINLKLVYTVYTDSIT